MPFGNRNIYFWGSFQFSIVPQFKEYHASGNLKFNNLVFFPKLKIAYCSEKKILPVSLKLNFTFYSKYFGLLWVNEIMNIYMDIHGYCKHKNSTRHTKIARMSTHGYSHSEDEYPWTSICILRLEVSHEIYLKCTQPVHGRIWIKPLFGRKM